MNKKVLVTGGAGFIGSHLVDHLLSMGYRVTALDNLSNGKMDNLRDAQKNTYFQFVHADVLNYDQCLSAMEGVDVVFHLACLGVRHSIHSPFENHRVNSEGTLNVLRAAKEKRINRFVYVSTSEVYGRTTKFPIVEENLTHPLTVYGASKLAGEHYTNAFFECYNMNTTVIRIFNNYGPRAHYEGDSGEIIPRTIVNLLNEKSPIIFGDGSVTRDFFFVRDTAKVLEKFIDRSDLAGLTYILGTGVETTMKSLLEKIIGLMDKNHIQITYLNDRPADVPRLWGDFSKIRSVINIGEQTDFEDGLRETIAYYVELNKTKDLLKDCVIYNWKQQA